MDGQVVAVPTREKIVAFEKEALKLPQLEIPVEHYFSEGIYMRRILIPAGACVTGKIHRHAHLNICTGDISVLTDEGVRRITGQHIILSSVGIKRVGFAHADTTWITVHLNPTNEREPEKLEAFYVADSYDELSAPVEPKALT